MEYKISTDFDGMVRTPFRRNGRMMAIVAIMAIATLGAWWWYQGQPITADQREQLRLLVAGVTRDGHVTPQKLMAMVDRELHVRRAEEIPRRDWSHAVEIIQNQK